MKNYIQLKIPFVTEEWRDIEGFEGLYQVSNMGRVKSLYTGKILKSWNNTKGYLQVQLFKDGKGKKCRVNRLVAQAFVPNDDPEHKTQCNHINESTLDNRAVNLNWITPKENINYGTGNERRSQKLVNYPDKSKPVKQLTLGGVLVTIWPSMQEAGRNGFNTQNICSCCNDKRKTANGFRWEYA